MTGETVSHYRVLERLGAGGMGVVYRGEDLRLGRPVAIQFLSEHVGTVDDGRLDRFRREARTGSALNHPNICVVHDIDEYHGQPFLVMELLDGETLAQRLATRPAGRSELLRWTTQIADALHAAHEKGIVHRDIKPANIFITSRGDAKVLDFGVAKLLGGTAAASDPTITDSAQTKQGHAVGTVAYMSPEQIRGEPLDGRSDIFSLGIVMSEMATGRRPFDGQTSGVIFDAILNRPPEPAISDAELARVVRKALEKDRELRYQTASDLLADLKRLQRDGTVGRIGTAPPGRGAGVGIVSAAATALLAIAVAVFVWLNRSVSTVHPTLDLKPTRVTANPSEYPVTGAALSPDGRFLTYSDPRGIHVRTMSTKETESIPNTAGIIVGGWSTDGTKVIGRRLAGREGSTTLSISIVGSGSRRPIQGLPSPDGHRALIISDGRLWIDDAKGRRQLPNLQLRPEELNTLTWAADSQRILVLRRSPLGPGASELAAIDAEEGRLDVVVGADVVPPHVRTMAVAGPASVIVSAAELSRTERYASQTDTNLWELRLDGKVPPRRLTNLTGFNITSLSATPDGSRVSFLQNKYQDDVWVAALEENGTRLSNPRRLTFDDRVDRPLSWTADSKSVIFISNRHGTIDTLVQDVDGEDALVFAGGPGPQTMSRASGDGRWLVFADVTDSPRIMRVSRPGAAPELITTTPEIIGLRCAFVGSGPCLVEVRQNDGSGAVVRLLHPEQGLGAELFRKPARAGGVTASPAFDRFAYVLPPLANDVRSIIRVVTPTGQVDREIVARDTTSLNSLDYSADGQGFFASDYSTDLGARLLHVTLEGATRVLWSNRAATLTWGVPSRDGKWLAFMSATQESNVYILERF